MRTYLDYESVNECTRSWVLTSKTRTYSDYESLKEFEDAEDDDDEEESLSYHFEGQLELLL